MLSRSFFLRASLLCVWVCWASLTVKVNANNDPHVSVTFSADIASDIRPGSGPRVSPGLNRQVNSGITPGMGATNSPGMGASKVTSNSVTVFEGDILRVATRSSPLRPSARAIALAQPDNLWPDGVVPYTIDTQLAADSVQVIDDAIAHWNEVGGISLLPLSDVQQERSEPIADSVTFVGGEFCASWIGRVGGVQEVWVAPHCTAGSVMHEIGHLLGLEHEHTRPDRDQYIQIHLENVTRNKEHNFAIAPSGSRLLGEYDYDSIMHYGEFNFSRNGERTISRIDGRVGAIGQRIAPSAGDLQAIATLYGSDLSIAVNLARVNRSTEIDIYVSNESVSGAHDVQVSIAQSSIAGEIVHADASTDNPWRCAREQLGENFTCSLTRLQAGTSQRLTIGLSQGVVIDDIGNDVDIVLSAKTPDPDLSNNTSTLDGVQPTVVDRPVLLLDESPILRPPLAMDTGDTKLQQDAIVNVATQGGSLDRWSASLMLLLLLLRKRFASCRIDDQT